MVVIGVTIGPEVDPAELEQIARATGGRSFVAPDPGMIGDVFLGALATLRESS